MHNSSPMLLHSLRKSPWLAKMALLWFLLTLGVAVASPFVNPQHQASICSASAGMVIVVLDDDSNTSSASNTLDCPLCVIAQASVPVQLRVTETIQPLGQVLKSIPAACLAAATAAPPPSRGPPSPI